MYVQTRLPHSVFSGLGDSDSGSDSTFGQKFGQGIIGGAKIGIATAQATQYSAKQVGLAAAAGTLALIAPFTGPAAPFIMAAAALIAPIASLFKGCGATCTQATQFANQAGDALTTLRDQYFAQPVRYESSQSATLGLMDQIFAGLQQNCGNPALGAAGQRCIAERLIRGAPAPWCDKPNKVGCDWITVLRDPVANDTGVVADAGSVLSAFGVNPSTTLFGIPLSSLILPAGVLLLVMAMDD